MWTCPRLGRRAPSHPSCQVLWHTELEPRPDQRPPRPRHAWLEALASRGHQGRAGPRLCVRPAGLSEKPSLTLCDLSEDVASAWQVEEGTPFARWFEKGRLSFPPDEEAAAMYSEAVAMLTAAGYEHYEVCRCREMARCIAFAVPQLMMTSTVAP